MFRKRRIGDKLLETPQFTHSQKKGKKDKIQHFSGKNVYIFIIIFHVAYRFFQCYAEYEHRTKYS
jgi:hypothetical protein